MSSTGDWDDIIEGAEAECFVGREQELDIFRQHINRTPPRYLIFYICGQGGAGKSTLLKSFREIAKGFGFLLTDCDEQQQDVPSVLGRFAHQLAEQGHPLKRFDERYKVYRQKMHEIENDPEAPQGLAALLGRTVVRAAFLGGDLVPGVRKGLEYLPKESLETQASQWATFLAKKLTNKDEVELIREPISVLTPLFFEDLNDIAKKRQVLLCFDNFEATRQELLEWLLRLREYKPSQNIRIAIAGRDEPGAKWDALRKVTFPIHLDVFTEQEAEAFLDAYSITEANHRKEIIECSGRLPVLMSWLSLSKGQEFDSTVPTHDIVERFLRWVTEATLRQAASLAAIPRTFNLDIMELLLSDASQSIDIQSAFDWLLTMPFVQQRSDSWRYHSVVRRMMLRYQKQKSPHTYQKMHGVLADFYNARRNEVSSSAGEEWVNEQWRKSTLEYMYHFLATNPVQHWGEVVSLFAEAMRKRRAFATEMIELLNAEDWKIDLSQEQNNVVQLFRQQLLAVENGALKDGFEMFNKLCTIPGLSSQAKEYAHAFRGECYRSNNKWENALSDFEEALRYIPKDAWAIASRGATYRQMERYEEALTDFDRAIALNEKYEWAIALRGATYKSMERYEEALADFDRAIALNEKDAWNFAERGATYQSMERYEEALTDFDRAIALNEKYEWAIALRGATYRQMERYEESLADLDRATALDEKYEGAIALRGETYRLMERYEEALADLDRAVALNEKDDWNRYHRALIHLVTRQKEAFKRDIQTAIELAQTALNESPDNWTVKFNIALYSLVDHNTNAKGQYEQLTSACLRLPRLKAAIEDLKDFLAIQQNNKQAQLIIARLEARIKDIQSSSTD